MAFYSPARYQAVLRAITARGRLRENTADLVNQAVEASTSQVLALAHFAATFPEVDTAIVVPTPGQGTAQLIARYASKHLEVTVKMGSPSTRAARTGLDNRIAGWIDALAGPTAPPRPPTVLSMADIDVDANMAWNAAPIVTVMPKLHTSGALPTISTAWRFSHANQGDRCQFVSQNIERKIEQLGGSHGPGVFVAYCHSHNAKHSHKDLRTPPTGVIALMDALVALATP